MTAAFEPLARDMHALYVTFEYRDFKRFAWCSEAKHYSLD